MVAKVLAIDTDGADLTEIAEKLQSRYCSVLSSKSIEDSLRTVTSQSIDIVFLAMPRAKTNLFIEFFSVLRQSCGMIPIVGVVNAINDTNSWIGELDIDSIMLSHEEEEKLILQVSTLLKGKNLFDEMLFQNFQIVRKARKTIVSLFYDNLDFIDLKENFRLISLDKLPANNEAFEDADMFIINGNHKKSFDSCVNLRLRKENKYKPIVMSFSNDSDMLDQSTMFEIGCSETINTNTHKMIIACRLNSLIKYKQFYEELSKHLKKSLFISAVDTTTGVYNRSFLDNYLDNLKDKTGKLTILMIDIDKFKNINDEYGHAFADSMLKRISGIIKENVRASDVIARYGGDEFIIVMNDIHKNVAISISERIQRQVEDCVFQNVSCTVSIGVCCIGQNETVSVRDAVMIADKFMYIAKQNGGNAVKICA